MKDQQYDEAKRLVRDHQIASAPFLQRRMRISHGSACGLISRMEKDGIVGPAAGARLRTIDLKRLNRELSEE